MRTWEGAAADLIGLGLNGVSAEHRQGGPVGFGQGGRQVGTQARKVRRVHPRVGPQGIDLRQLGGLHTLGRPPL
jgi:hypothetical protein